MIRTLCGVGIFISTLFFFWLTRYPTVAYIDSGELAVVNGTLGIAHPTGYPIYTLLGRVFALLPLELMTTQILFAALCVAAAVTILFFVLLRVLPADEPVKVVPAAFGVLLFSSAPLIWSQGTTNEVYSLHLLFVSLIAALLLSRFDVRKRVIGPYVVALSFANHMSTVLLLPAVAIHLVHHRREIWNNRRVFLLTGGAVALAASAYLYLPLRSALDPVFNWGQPQTWENFVRHVTGWQYQVWMFSQSAAMLGSRLREFAVIFWAQFPLPFWVLIAAGIVGAWKAHGHAALLLTTIIVFNVLYALNFMIPDIDNYLLPTVVALFIFGMMGLHWLWTMWRIPAWIGAALLALLVVWNVAKNRQTNDQSDNYAALDGVHNIYASADTNALIFCADWDIVSPWLYSHFSLRERPDVIVIDNELARRSWYFDWIRHADPALYAHALPEIERFLPQVRRFERGEVYEAEQIETAYRALLMKMLQYRGRTLYIDQSANMSFPPPGEVMISGQLLRIRREGETAANEARELKALRFGKPDDALNQRERLNVEKLERMKGAMRK